MFNPVFVNSRLPAPVLKRALSFLDIFDIAVNRAVAKIFRENSTILLEQMLKSIVYDDKKYGVNGAYLKYKQALVVAIYSRNPKWINFIFIAFKKNLPDAVSFLNGFRNNPVVLQYNKRRPQIPPPLHLATKLEALECVKMLVRKRCAEVQHFYLPTAKSQLVKNEYPSALTVACQQSNLPIAQVLIGETEGDKALIRPLKEAIKQRDPEMVTLIRSNIKMPYEVTTSLTKDEAITLLDLEDPEEEP